MAGMCFACNREGDTEQYSLVEGASRTQSIFRGQAGTIKLTEDARLVGVSDDLEGGFGFITAVAASRNGEIYAADARRGAISVFDADGRVTRTIGRRGTGTGEFLSVAALLRSDSRVIAYDSQLNSLVIFDTLGVPVRNVPLPDSLRVADLAARNPTELVLSLVGRRKPIIVAYDLMSARVTRVYIDANQRGPDSGEVSPAAAHICISGDQMVVANPFIYELIAIELRTGRVQWTRQWKSSVRSLGTARERRGLRVPRSVILGLVCSSDHMLLGYFELSTGRLYYDFFRSNGEPLGRVIFNRSSAEPFPGFPAAIVRDRIISFRTRPRSEIFVHSISVGAN